MAKLYYKYTEIQDEGELIYKTLPIPYRNSIVELVYYEACLSDKDAVMREKQLKTGFGRAYLKRRLA